MDRLPGFTADTSLYQTHGQYRTAATQAIAPGQVVPTQMQGCKSMCARFTRICSQCMARGGDYYACDCDLADACWDACFGSRF
jgi:hypothetical protein